MTAKDAPAPPKRKISLCPTCGQPAHKDPATGRFTKHPADPGPIETGGFTRWRDTDHPAKAAETAGGQDAFQAGADAMSGKPKRRGLFRRKRSN